MFGGHKIETQKHCVIRQKVDSQVDIPTMAKENVCRM